MPIPTRGQPPHRPTIPSSPAATRGSATSWTPRWPTIAASCSPASPAASSEVGAGHGLNFPHYPTTVTEVLAVEPEPYLCRLAAAAASQAPVPIRVVDGTAEALPAPDAAFDAVVASLVLCTVADPVRALAEARRVLRPGGRCASTSTSAPTTRGWPAGRTGSSAHGAGLPATAPQPGHGGGHHRRAVCGGAGLLRLRRCHGRHGRWPRAVSTIRPRCVAASSSARSSNSNQNLRGSQGVRCGGDA